MRRIDKVLAMLAAPVATCAAAPLQAQDYPNRPIMLVVPYAAGGGNDVMARIVADKMSKTLGQQIVIENRGGAGGTIATRAVAKSAPTATRSSSAAPARSPSTPRSIPTPATIRARTSRPSASSPPARWSCSCTHRCQRASIEELIALAKKEPGKLNYASAGPGSGIHLGTELFASMAGIRFTHIPYRGPRPRSTISSAATSTSISARCRPRSAWSPRARCGLSPSRDRGGSRAPRPADGGRGWAARLRGRAALRHRRARRHAAADRRQAQRRLARGAGRRRHPHGHGRAPASSRCPARPRTTPPTSTARRPSGPHR